MENIVNGSTMGDLASTVSVSTFLLPLLRASICSFLAERMVVEPDTNFLRSLNILGTPTTDTATYPLQVGWQALVMRVLCLHQQGISVIDDL